MQQCASRRRPRKGKTATRWRLEDGEGPAMVFIVDGIRFASCCSKRPLAWKHVLRHLQALKYGVHNDEATLKANYWTAVNRLMDLDERPLSLPEAYALVDLVEEHCVLGPHGWEIDWPRALKKIHPNDRWMTTRRFRARYEGAMAQIEGALREPLRRDGSSSVTLGGNAPQVTMHDG